MKRPLIFDQCSALLARLSVEIEAQSKLNLLALHIHSENFYRDFLGILLGFKFRNTNKTNQNSQAIDLIDEKNKVVAQVSATATTAKIQNSLRSLPGKYNGFRFKFISISKDASALRKTKYTAPKGIIFDPKDDILDIASLLRALNDLEIG